MNANLTNSTGLHHWKFGYEFRRTAVQSFFDAGYRGSLRFASLDDFIAGIPSGGSQARGDSSRQTSQNTHGFYLQDNFKLSSRLTLNYGLRWDYFGVIGEAQNRFSILTPDGTPAGNLHRVSQLYPRDLHDFAPRASLAYSLWKNEIMLRGGYGWYYDGFSQDVFLGQLAFNTFNPGPAFNGIGPDAIQFGLANVGLPIQRGVPVFGNFAATSVFTVDQKLRTPYVQEYNVNLETALSSQVTLSLGYVGSKGSRLFRYLDLNQFNPAPHTFAFPALFAVNQIQTTANSNYNALQASLSVHSWHGIASSVHCTWSMRLMMPVTRWTMS